jgi:hypothetical protein
MQVPEQVPFPEEGLASRFERLQERQVSGRKQIKFWAGQVFFTRLRCES